MTAKIGDVPFETASAISSFYGTVSALILRLDLGASFSFGAFAVQLASNAGYAVVGVASAHNAQLVEWLGAAHSSIESHLVLSKILHLSAHLKPFLQLRTPPHIK
ncbi:hypothetical protein V1506DRAFT_509572 [Lipomyces tetrasporus]